MAKPVSATIAIWRFAGSAFELAGFKLCSELSGYSLKGENTAGSFVLKLTTIKV
jgi:hypothetical protein